MKFPQKPSRAHLEGKTVFDVANSGTSEGVKKAWESRRKRAQKPSTNKWPIHKVRDATELSDRQRKQMDSMLERELRKQGLL